MSESLDFDALLAECEAEEAARAADMPTEQDAINAMFRAYLRLKELGWREAIYCPKDGTRFRAIEAGSTWTFPCHYMGDWPNGFWFAEEAGDLWPFRPVLFKLIED